MENRELRGRSGVGLLSGIARFFAGFGDVAEDGYGGAPVFEALEPRVLLSANPLSDLLSETDVRERSNVAATHAPRSTQSADTEAPVIESVTASHAELQTFTSIYFTIKASDNVKVTSYRLMINGDNIHIYPNGRSISYTFKEAGTYAVVAIVRDAAGNTATHTSSLTVRDCPDVKPPVINCTSLRNGGVYNKNIGVTVLVHDSDSLEINWNAKLINNATGEETILASGNRETRGYQRVATLKTSDYSEGSYTFILEAVDKGGNRSRWECTFSIDRTPPVISIESTARLEAGQEIWFTVAAEDANGIAARTLRINGTNISLDGNGRGCFTFASPGEYVLVATARDSAGNVSTLRRTITVTENTDFLAPDVAIVSPEAGSYYGQESIAIRARIDDRDSDDFTWRVQIRDSRGNTRVLARGSGKVADEVVAAFEPSYWSPGGVYVIEIVAADPAGNTGIASREIIIVKEKAAVKLDYLKRDPAGRIPVSLGNLGWIRTPRRLTGSIKAGDVPVDLVSWSVIAKNYKTGQTHVLCAGTGSPVDGVFGTFDPKYLPGGEYRITLSATDIVGNVSSDWTSYYLDGQPPVVRSVTYSVEGLWLNLYIEATDDWDSTILNGARYYKDGGRTGLSINRRSGKASFHNSPAGIHQFDAYVSDAAGNETWIGTFVVTVRKKNDRIRAFSLDIAPVSAMVEESFAVTF